MENFTEQEQSMTKAELQQELQQALAPMKADIAAMKATLLVVVGAAISLHAINMVAVITLLTLIIMK